MTPISSHSLSIRPETDSQSSSVSSSELGMVKISRLVSGWILLVKVPRYSTSGGEGKGENKVGVLSLPPMLLVLGEAVAPSPVDLGI